MQSKHILWNAFGSILYLGCQWLVTVLVTRLFGYEDAGVLSLAMSISATFQTIALFGIRNYQVSDMQEKYSDGTYIGFRRICCVAAMVLCMAFSLANSYENHQLLAIFWFMVFRLAENYSDVLHGIAQKSNRLDIAGKAFAIKGIETIVTFLAGYFIFDNLVVSIALMAVGSWITTWIYDSVYVRKLTNIRPLECKKDCFRLGMETLPLCIYAFLSSTISTMPKYILEKMCDATVLGAYSSIFAPALLIQAAAGYIYSPFVGKFAEYFHEGKIQEFRKLFLQLTFVIVGIAAVGMMAGNILGSWILQLLFGQDILAYIDLLIPILLSICTTAYFGFLCMLQVVVRNFRILIIGCMLGVALCTVSTPLAIHEFGANGASYGLIVGACGAMVPMLISLFCKQRIRN